MIVSVIMAVIVTMIVAVAMIVRMTVRMAAADRQQGLPLDPLFVIAATAYTAHRTLLGPCYRPQS